MITIELIHKVFSNSAQNYKNHQWLSVCAILAIKNNNVNAINFTIQNIIESEGTTYKPIDTISNQDEFVNYLTKFLNFLYYPCMLPYVLTVKIDDHVILLQK